MSKTSSSEGTKIAQAAKELNVTSVTIRRYLSEFNIDTSTDEYGVKVLPAEAMDELSLIRELKEAGMTNPQVLEELEKRRSKPKAKVNKPKAAVKSAPKTASRIKNIREDEEEEKEEKEEKEVPAQPVRRATRQVVARAVADKVEKEEIEPAADEPAQEALAEPTDGSVRSKHTLTCQTCSKVFEHMNPRLRDCLDCYRTKRKERRRGGSDKHKNVIQHPVVQQVIAKSSQQQLQQLQQPPIQYQPTAPRESYTPQPQPVATVPHISTVRNYRKAIEETRGITSSLKRRLERPDLPEGERRWLEQIYAYQLILHQGWRHLAEYKAGTKEQNRGEQ